MSGPLDGVFSGPPSRSVIELLRVWWGIECAEAPVETAHPPILHQLWQADAHRLAWGHQDILLPPGGVKERNDGYVEFFVENQSVWRIAYMPNGGPNPPVAALVDGPDGNNTLPLGMSLHEFLARALVIEAVFGATWWTNGELLAGHDIARWLVWPEVVADPDLFMMPALYSDGKTLCFAFGPDGTSSAFYGAATREELASSAFADVGRWFEPEPSSGPRFAPN